MTQTIKGMLTILATCALAFTCATAGAAAVTWTINSASSSIKLSIPDQTVDGQQIAVRNSTGGSGWTVGSTASVSGTLATNYSEGGSLDFVPGSSIVGLNTGSYRPNPAAFNSTSTSTSNPFGVYTNTSTAPGVYGGRFVLPESLNATVAYMAFRNVNFGIDSGAMPFVGNTFDTVGLNFGIASSLVYIDGIGLVIPVQIIPDLIDEPLSSSGVNSISNGTILDLGGLNRRITILINVPISLTIGEIPMIGALTGQIVANAVVPEPSTLMMAGIGLVSLAVCARRRRRCTSPVASNATD